MGATQFTNAQRLIWSGQAMHPGSPLYNMIMLFRIDGAVDSKAFERAFVKVVEASDALSSVVATDGITAGMQPGKASAYYGFVDLSGNVDTTTALRAWISDRKNRTFNAEQSLIDSVLIRLSGDEYAWYFNAHHLVTDGWSGGLVFEHVSQQYVREIADESDNELELPPYGALVEFEQKLSDNARYLRAGAYWEELAAKSFGVPKLYGRSTSSQSTSSIRRPVRLDDRQMSMLRALSQDDRVRGMTDDLSLHTVVLAILGVFVSRTAGITEFAVSMPGQNRPTAVLRKTIGVFVELFPVVCDYDEEASFFDHVQMIRQRSQATFQHALPGLGRPEMNRRSSVVLNYVGAKIGSFAGMPVRTEWVHCDNFDANHALRLHVHDFDDSGELTLLFDFASDVFTATQQDEAIDQFLRLFEAFVADPHQPIGKPSLVPGPSLEVGVDVDAPKEIPDLIVDDVLDRFDLIVRETPHAIAVSSDSRSLSYLELANKSNEISDRLLSAGVVAGDRVGILLERGLEFVAAILACLRTGAAYVPIEESAEVGRITSILRQSDVAALISDQDVAGISDAPRINPFDSVDVEGAGSVQAVSRSVEQPASLAAYVIFTSGSSGAPKGVVVSRAALARYVDWAGTAFAKPGPITMPLFTSLSYDLAVTSVFVPLTTGGTVRVYRSSDALEDASLIRRVLTTDVHDVVKLTPSHLTIAADLDPQLNRLQSLVLGGEALRSGLSELFYSKFDGRVRVLNEYGPTEATVGCMIYEFDPTDAASTFVPIGKGNLYSEILLLDSFGNEVPDGVAAEVVVAGPGLADGYLNDAALTAAAFVRHPFRPEQKAYRTGDAAVRNAYGDLVYSGRIDDQIKIAGVRIEPEEIESALRSVDGVEFAVITVERSENLPEEEREEFCGRCGLSTKHPAASLNEDGVCNVCVRFDKYADRASTYFRNVTELKERFRESRRSHPHAEFDCLALLSGGKDSTYALGQLVDMGLRVHAFTLDNGFISPEAIANISRVVESLGVSHEFATTEAMNAIFVDSLRRHSNVCNGCFKTIYTLALQRAEALSIPIIVTGLSRGQFFETRLTPELFETVSDPLEQIDETVLAARKAYHRVKDAVLENIDTTFLRDGALLDEIQFVDFYRYTDVSLDEMMSYLDARMPWVRPTDTGRSTNCLINDVGIHVHKRERGYHNYAWPYSWDVRVGHKQRDAALDELNDDINEKRTRDILNQLGYSVRRRQVASDAASLYAYYVAPDAIDVATFRSQLAKRLPRQAIPARFIQVESIPLTPNGKVDRERLREAVNLDAARGDGFIEDEIGLGLASGATSQPESEIEKILFDIWNELLGHSSFGIDSPFLDIGGSSILAIQVIARISHAFEVDLPFSSAFQAPTIRELALVVEAVLYDEIEANDPESSSSVEVSNE